MMRWGPMLPAILGPAFLFGCAAASQSVAVEQKVEPDCSFRSASTCWTVAGRFPPPRPEAGKPSPTEIIERPTVVANRADSVSSRTR
jgi:hypothetical protein